MEIQIPPTKDLVDNYVTKFNKDDKDHPADQAITNLVNAFRENETLENILLKFSAINTLYSTNIYDKFKISNHILNKSIDKGLEQGDPGIVDIIRKGHGIKSDKGNDRDLYSFATKYCSWHDTQNAYPIYDNLVEKLLLEYQKEGGFCKNGFKASELKDYKRFKEILTEFKTAYGLNDYEWKDFDKFLWKYGKDIFSETE